MIDSFTIFSKTGTILYQHHHHTTTPIQNTIELLNHFISTILLETSSTPTSRKCTLSKKSRTTPTIAEWDDSGERIAIVFYAEVLQGRKDMTWVKRLLKVGLKEYALFHDARVGNECRNVPPEDCSLFDTTFLTLLKRAEALGRRELNDKEGDEVDKEEEEEEEGEHVDVRAGIARLKARRERQQQQQQQQHQQQKKKDTSSNTTKKKKGKEMTVWHDGTGKVTKSALAQLDRSKDGTGDKIDSIEAAMADDSRTLLEARATYLPESDQESPFWLEDDDGDDDDDTITGSGWGQSLKGLIDQMSGNKIMTDSDLDAPLAEMQRMLVSKNVANDIADELCDSVRMSLVGKKLQSFTRIGTTVRTSLEKTVAKLLSPHRDIDVLRDVVRKRDSWGGRKRPYVIVMVGINGVGKSTTLAKIAYYLKSNGCSPLIAACDTFRSGAVEQLGVHAKCLNLPLFHRGYAKDSSVVAKDAIAHAMEQGNDVVLVDTAGRMQNNVPLMKALAKLVSENKPDLVCFVGEALVGNDGVDQLKMFDAALGSGRIDGIVLTKFDTVSDKVGAALTMTKVTGAKVLFVGVGEKYNHLKKLSVKGVIKSLFS